MFDLVKLVLQGNYYYCRFIGVLNFEIDLDTGQAKQTRRATLYAIMANTLVFSCLPLLGLYSDLHNAFSIRINALYEYIFVIVLFLRLLCVYLTILDRWWHLSKLVPLVSDFRRLALRQPRVVRLWRRRILVKFFTALLTESLNFVMMFVHVEADFSAGFAASAILLFILISLLSVIMGQHYMVALNIHIHYKLLIEQLRLLLEETHSLEQERRRGVRVLKYCALADRLDELADTQSMLQSLVLKMQEIFSMQSLCTALIEYMTLLSGCYYIFCAFKYNLGFGLYSWRTVLCFATAGSFSLDMHIALFVFFDILKAHAEFCQLLNEDTTMTHGLDIRLARAFEQFHLQIAQYPFNLPVLGLYLIQCSMYALIGGSITYYTLVLIQYDVQNL